MKHSGQKKRMLDEPVHKPKAVSFGPTIVYDAERCIMCTRCVRFCDEVAKDPVLSLSQRGNLNEITVAPGRQLDHAYTLMTEVVCPVGALTAKDFRFKARVWFLRSVNSVCTGCARGCNSETDYDPRCQKVFRYRPRKNAAINGHWMCDEGMLSYQRITEGRITEARAGSEATTVEAAISQAKGLLRGSDGKLVKADALAILLGAEFSLEDNAALLWLGRQLGVEVFFEAGRPDGQADQVLRLADKNGNTAGLRELLDGEPARIEELTDGLRSGRYTHVIALGSQLKDASQEPWFSSLRKNLIVLGSHGGALATVATVFLPVAVPAESTGTFVNAAGTAQVSEQAVRPAGNAQPAHRVVLSLIEALGFGRPWANLTELRRLLLEKSTTAAPQPAIDNTGAVST
jgi:NADH-quinone oxidoreductase subunit G